MTSEIVVMNSLGVALASDSAATVGSEDAGKVFNSADKLFMLSKRHPVGVMIYGNASLLGVPWETIIKMFRRQLDGTVFPRLEDYGRELVRYLNEARRLFPRPLQERFFLRTLAQVYSALADRIEDEIYERVVVGSDESESASEIAATFIFKERNRWSSEPVANCLPADIGARMVGQFSGKVNDLIAASFGPFQIKAPETQALYELARLIVSQERIADVSLTGVVVAGFGEDEHFPVMQPIDIGEVYEDQLKCLYKPVRAIDAEQTSWIEPFAEAEMVNTFLHGMNPRYELRMMREIAELVTKFPDAMLDAVSDLTPPQKKKWKKKFEPASRNAVKTLIDQLKAQREERHLGPIRQAITNMPKDELGHAAARLVSLNWFQKRMSLKNETVGGPVDVAVITRGDGFIWIQRKHYFQPELNHHFFDNYHNSQEQVGDQHERAKGEKTPQRDTRAQPRRRSHGGARRAAPSSPERA